MWSTLKDEKKEKRTCEHCVHIPCSWSSEKKRKKH